ncbi:Thymidylate kinase [Xylographa bjoerkii]|nr:Thymidylate kinase [Xylographa bjoerkii]
MARGALIVIEGLDRAGKSTQCEHLFMSLEKDGFTVKRMRFPERSTAIGKSIDAYLKGETTVEDHVIHLLFSANRWEAAAQIRADIESGTTMIIDRYSYSGAVYSAAKENPTLTLEWAWQVEAGLPAPDLCIFLDIEPEAAKRRGCFGAERYENAEMQQRVRSLFKRLFTTTLGDNTVVIDAGRSKELVERDVLQSAKAFLDSKRRQEPLNTFESLDDPCDGCRYSESSSARQTTKQCNEIIEP